LGKKKEREKKGDPTKGKKKTPNPSKFQATERIRESFCFLSA